MNFSALLQKPGPLLAGVVNITPDSFSDGGKLKSADSAIAYARMLIKHGASLLDIGGESTGPGASSLPLEEEWARIGTVVKELGPLFPVSVDTYKSEIASRALEAGAIMINDVSGLRADFEMAHVIAEHSAYVVIMHSKEPAESPHAELKAPVYQDIIAEIVAFLEERIAFALESGIAEEKIILDPGMGAFLSSEAKVSWEVLNRLEELTRHFKNFPFLIGASRKGFLGGAVSERDPISQLVQLDAFEKGAKILRTHNVRMAREFIECWQRVH